MRSAYSLRNERGLSIVELLIMVVIVSLILIAVPTSFRAGTEIWEKGNRHDEILQNALIGMEDLTRELRQAKEIRAISASGASNGYIDFKYKDDIDGDGDKEYKYQKYEYTGTEDYIQYAWSDKETKDLSSKLNPLAGPVNSLSFTAYKGYSVDDEGDMVEQPATADELEYIRSVHIKMITYDDQGKVDPIPLSTRVYLRTWIQGYAMDFAIFGDDGVDLGDNPLYIGFYAPPQSNVGANNDIYMGAHTTINGDVHHAVGGELTEGNNDVVLNGNDYGPDEYILLPSVTTFYDEQWWGVEMPPDAASNASDVDVNGEDIYIDGEIYVSEEELYYLPPGIYGDLTLANNSILNLVAGTYWLSSITGQNDVSIKIHLAQGEPAGDIRVFVDENVVLGNTLDATTSLIIEGPVDGGGAEHVYFETHYDQDYDAQPADYPAWSMGQNALWYGAIYAPYGNIDISDGVIVGQLISGGTVTVHGGNSSQIETPINETMIDFVMSEHIATYGYSFIDE